MKVSHQVLSNFGGYELRDIVLMKIKVFLGRIIF